MQRIGRANHRLDEPSRAVLIPANRFEVLECRVAIDAIAENAQDTPPLRTGALDVLAQHVLGCACGEPFLSDELYAEVLTSAPYASLTRTDFDDVVDFVATGGYALKAYERFARIKQDKQGRWRVANPKVRQSYRLNVGTIVEEAMLKVRLVRGRGGGAGSTGMIGRGGRMMSEIEEYFIEGLVAGDTFVFGGEIVRYEALVEDQVYVSRANDKDAKVPSYMGGKFPLSTYLAERVRKLLDDRRQWNALPEQVRDWLSLQKNFSLVPAVRELLVETFPRGGKHYFVCYPFEGRLAHQTLGMLLTRRLERARARPLGFVANEYALAIWGVGDMSFMVRHGKLDLDALFNPDMLGDDLEAWLAESALMKRTFRNCALISGLIARRFTDEDKTRRQVLFSTDLIYDVLRKHQADHVLLRGARADAASGLLDLRRLGDMLSRIHGRLIHKELDRVSPPALPVMLAIVIARHDPGMVIALGDSFHDRDAHQRLSDIDRGAITALQAQRDWIWISGNHDPALPSELGGVVASEVAIGPIAFRHQPTGAVGEIAGHLHPKARVATRGRSMERRCFACDDERAVMPAFGAYTGGLSIRDAAFAKIFGSPGFMAHVLGDNRLHAIAASRCY